MQLHISYIRIVTFLELGRISSIFDTAATKKLVLSLVLSGLDYCNSHLAGMINRLQHVLNSAARLILRAPRFEQARYSSNFTGFRCLLAFFTDAVVLLSLLPALHSILLLSFFRSPPLIQVSPLFGRYPQTDCPKIQLQN